jgi:hypothetical protein
MLMDVQLSMTGLYLPPVFKSLLPLYPPQTIISLPVQTAVCWSRASGTPVMLMDVQLSMTGLYLPPVFKSLLPLYPPQTIISLPVQTAVCRSRLSGALTVLLAVQRQPQVYRSYLRPSTV